VANVSERVYFSHFHCQPWEFHLASKSIQGLGDKTIVKDESGERVERIGAGGWGGGVHLVTSDQETQDVNRVNLERFLKKQQRLKEMREREAAAKQQE
jgi:hypothetical protein